ncbi:hypothetical protein BD410DRAFT_788244 [Rickenella mellea]|uniref:Uncharacterized protein n=1 Tax=Rickenella mellea TaxID=50990 RepID=A0A4Y7Q5D3_9AGAM|nr:hypothetical protein BD410DRAFT_788244 [Rickenella mellea]
MTHTPSTSSETTSGVNSEPQWKATQESHASMSPPMLNTQKPANTQISVEESLATPFLAFSSDEILGPGDDEEQKDIEFQNQLHQMLLQLVLEFHAWSTSRPAHETAIKGEAILSETKMLRALEGEQESTRLRLIEFISRVKSALAALTSFGL